MEYRHSELWPDMYRQPAAQLDGDAIDRHMAVWADAGFTLHSTTTMSVNARGVPLFAHIFTWQREKPAADSA